MSRRNLKKYSKTRKFISGISFNTSNDWTLERDANRHFSKNKEGINESGSALKNLKIVSAIE